MNVVKHHREKLGLTQPGLSEKTGLSLRTIQRVEASEKAPKGHTLKVLSEAFELAPQELQAQFISKQNIKNHDQDVLKQINLSILIFFVFPFGNIVLPLLIWQRNKHLSDLVNEVGKRIVNFQIFWSIVLSLFSIVAPFINHLIKTSIPIIIVGLLGLVIYNMYIVLNTARQISSEKYGFLKLPIHFL
ncbi:MAG: helix-turn-helix domain-containing protein [Bacteroidota bacterium]